MHLRVNMLGRSYDAAAQVIPDRIQLSDSAKIDDALGQLAQLMPAGREIPASCLVVLNGQHLGTLAAHQNSPLAHDDELVLIAPVAGG